MKKHRAPSHWTPSFAEFPKAINLYKAGPTPNPAYRTSGGYPVSTYVIDSGIQPHSDLNYNSNLDHVSFDCHDNVGGNCTLVNPTPVVPSQMYTAQCDSHGTYVAGVIGGQMQSTPIGIEGVAPGARLISIRVTNSCISTTGLGGLAYTSGVLAAIGYISNQVPNNGVDAQGRRRLSAVANISIIWDIKTLSLAARAAMNTSITAAVNKGVFFSFAAGNSYQNACEIYPGAIGTSLPGAMSVSAMQMDGGGMDNRPLIPIANWDTDPGLKLAPFGHCVEIWAPGRDVQSSVAFQGGIYEAGGWGFVQPLSQFQPGQDYFSPQTGSSLAAPHVAGAALLLAKKYQRAGVALPSPADIETILKSRTRFMGNWRPPVLFDPGALITTPINVLTVDNL